MDAKASAAVSKEIIAFTRLMTRQPEA